jgi:hypothetical protein
MRYMLMMHAPYGTGEYDVAAWRPEDLTAHIGFMRDLNQDLTAKGEFIGGEGLAPPSQARIVDVGADGAPIVTDGPFAESKEFLAGFWIVEVESAERAFEIAARISGAPGPGGGPTHIKVEVRQVLSAPPVEV